jgi:hypothetical protein
MTEKRKVNLMKETYDSAAIIDEVDADLKDFGDEEVWAIYGKDEYAPFIVDYVPVSLEGEDVELEVVMKHKLYVKQLQAKEKLEKMMASELLQRLVQQDEGHK